MEGHPLLEKIDILLSKFKDPAYPDDLEKIKSVKESVEDLLAREALFDNPKLKEILLEFSGDVEQIDKKLLTEDSKVMNDYDRDRALDKKNLYLKFLEKFNITTIRKSLEDVDKEVSEELASLEL